MTRPAYPETSIEARAAFEPPAGLSVAAAAIPPGAIWPRLEMWRASLRRTLGGALALADVRGTDPTRPTRNGAAGPLPGAPGRGSFSDRRSWPDPGVRLGGCDPRRPPARLSPDPETVLAAEVLHVRIGSSPETPWAGTAPLRRASLTSELLSTLEGALAEVYAHAPLGSQIVPFPEAGDQDLEALGRGFRGRRGRVLLRESVTVTAAGGPAPSTDWRPSDVTPDLARSMTRETLDQALDGIAAAFGVLPGLFSAATTGPMVREA